MGGGGNAAPSVTTALACSSPVSGEMYMGQSESAGSTVSRCAMTRRARAA